MTLAFPQPWFPGCTQTPAEPSLVCGEDLATSLCQGLNPGAGPGPQGRGRQVWCWLGCVGVDPPDGPQHRLPVLGFRVPGTSRRLVLGCVLLGTYVVLLQVSHHTGTKSWRTRPSPPLPHTTHDTEMQRKELVLGGTHTLWHIFHLALGALSVLECPYPCLQGPSWAHHSRTAELQPCPGLGCVSRGERGVLF